MNQWLRKFSQFIDIIEYDHTPIDTLLGQKKQVKTPER